MAGPMAKAVAGEHAAYPAFRQMLTGSAVNAAIYKIHFL
jgi:hypothetical protein